MLVKILFCINHSLLLRMSLLTSAARGPLPSSLSIILNFFRIYNRLSMNTGSNQSLIMTFLNFGISKSIYTSSSYSSTSLPPAPLFCVVRSLFGLVLAVVFFFRFVVGTSAGGCSRRWISSSSILLGSRSLEYLQATRSMN